MKIDFFDQVVFQFNSGPIPPPFCFRYSISITSDKKESYSVQADLEYYDRDEISEDEIIAEGFTMDDDFRWKGELPTIWGEEIIQQVNVSNWKKRGGTKPHKEGLIIKVEHDKNAETLEPANIRSWEVFIQEIIQACFELSKKEAPLYIGFVNKKEANSLDQLNITYSFAEKKVTLDVSSETIKTLNWSDGRKLLKYIFGIDYAPENGFEEIPFNAGTYISPGDGMWYLLHPGEGKGVESSKEEQLSALLLKYLT